MALTFVHASGLQYDRRNNRVGLGAAPCRQIGTGELVLDPCDPSLAEEARSAAAAPQGFRNSPKLNSYAHYKTLTCHVIPGISFGTNA